MIHNFVGIHLELIRRDDVVVVSIGNSMVSGRPDLATFRWYL